MSEAKLTEGDKDKDPDEVQSNAMTNNTPRGVNSSRRGSIDSEGYQGYNALKHHLHFETHSPYKKKKGRIANAAGVLGLTFGRQTKNKKIEFELTPELLGQTPEELEKTQTNLLLEEQINK